jgi:hypothetical protein
MVATVLAAAHFILAGSCAAEECTTLLIASGALQQATVGEPYRQKVPIFGGKSPVSIILKEGGLPRGLSFTPDGVVSGMPEEPGSHRITFFASDSCPQHQDAVQTLQLLVGEKGRPLEMDASVIVKPRLSVAVNSMPAAITLHPGNAGAEILYQVSATTKDTAILDSYGLSFQVNGAVVQNVPLPLPAVLINGKTELKETVTIPKAVLEAAQREQDPKIIVSRAFMGRGTTALGVVQFTFAPVK